MIRAGGAGLGGVLTKTGLGTVVEEGECVLTVTQQSGKGRYDKIVAMIEESEQLKSTAENHAAHLADRLVPTRWRGVCWSIVLTRNVTRACPC